MASPHEPIRMIFAKVHMPEELDLVAAPLDVRGLYDRHGRKIRALLARLTGPGFDVDDLLQEVFVVALRRGVPATAQAAEEQRAWLMGIAAKLAQAARRKARLRQFFGLETLEHLAHPDSPERSVEQSQAKRRVYEVLNSLSERKRTVFILFELEGLSGPEIAAALRIPLKTVWTRLFHARREFKERLARVEAAASRRRP